MISITLEEFKLWGEISNAVHKRIKEITPIIAKTNKYSSANSIDPKRYILMEDGNMFGLDYVFDPAWDRDYECTCSFPFDFLFMSNSELESMVNKILEQEDADRKASIEKSEREQEERDYKKYLELKKRFEKSNGGKEN